MKVTLHDVAARAEVSIATASRALNGLAVSPASAERVRLAASELGYVANEAARALRSERTQTMGLIFYDLRNTLGIELIDALSETIEAAGYSLLIASARTDAARYDLLMRRFLERRIDALFCINPRGAGESLSLYDDAATPVIALFGAGSAFSGLPLLTPSFTESAAALAADLNRQGHTHAAIVADKTRSPPMQAINDALKTARLAVDWIQPSEAGGMSEAVADIVRARPRPTAVISLTNHARGVLAACEAARIEVPRDLSLISLSEVGADARQKRLGVSSLIVDPHRMGRAAAGSMLAWVAGSRPAGRVLVQAATWEPRATTGPARVDVAEDVNA